MEEFKVGTAKSCLEKNERIESNMIPFLKGQHRDQAKLEIDRDKTIEQRKAAKQKFYDLIGKAFNNSLPLSLELLKDKLQELLIMGLKYRYHLRTPLYK